MSDLFWLTDEQMARLQPFFPKSHGKPRVDEGACGAASCSSTATGWLARCAQRLRSSQDAVQWWKRWGERGVFKRMMEGLAAGDAEPKTVMIDATYLKAHRTASSLRLKRGISAA